MKASAVQGFSIQAGLRKSIEDGRLTGAEAILPSGAALGAFLTDPDGAYVVG